MFVYIIKSIKDNKFYTGFTNDIDRRLEEHNKGCSSTPSTTSRSPFVLVHVELVENRKDARALEKWMKSGIGRDIRKELFE